MFDIVELKEVDDEVVAAFARLIPQLSQVDPPNQSHLKEIVNSESTTILLARDSNQGNYIVGALSLVIFRTPTNKHAWIEDVVVDQNVRNQGIGEALTRAGLELAFRSGVKNVDLTSRSSRVAANRLYQRMGFKKRSTNLYRFTLED